MSKIEFMQSVKIVPNKEKEILLKIQEKIKEKGICKENIIELTKNLTYIQKRELIKLYIEQIESLKSNTEQCKNKIILQIS